jgi:hypothetical protein
MSYQAHSFVDSLKVETVAEKAVLHAMAHRHSYRTAILEISESEIARGSAVSKRHVIDVLKALEARRVIRRTRKGKSSGWASRFEFVNFHFRPLGSQWTGEPGSSVLVNSSPATGELASPAYKEESKTKCEAENQIPPTPLFQRGASPTPQPVVRRKLSSRDVRDLVKAIDSILAAGIGTAIQFSEAFERACAKRLIHPDDARRAIGLTTDLDFESRKPPERATG